MRQCEVNTFNRHYIYRYGSLPLASQVQYASLGRLKTRQIGSFHGREGTASADLNNGTVGQGRGRWLLHADVDKPLAGVLVGAVLG